MLMKIGIATLIIALAAVASTTLTLKRVDAAAISIFPTGVDALRNQLPGGAPDPHYLAQNNAGPVNQAVALSRSNYWPTWPAPTTGGEWIDFADSTQTF